MYILEVCCSDRRRNLYYWNVECVMCRGEWRGEPVSIEVTVADELEVARFALHTIS
jgi:hypothetical protein